MFPISHHAPAKSNRSSLVRRVQDLLGSRQRLLTVPYMRGSSREQRSDGNMDRRARLLVQNLEAEGAQVYRHSSEQNFYGDVCCGKRLDGRQGLEGAVRRALQLQRSYPSRCVVVVSDTRNRFLRGRGFNGHAGTDKPVPAQWAELERVTKGVTLTTWLDPLADDDAVRRYESSVGEALGEKRIGRPPYKSWRASGKGKSELVSEAMRLRSKGESLRSIAQKLNIKLGTLHRWIRQRLEPEPV